MYIDNLQNTYILTADIGGSHITAAVCELTTNTIIQDSLVRIEICSKGSAENILNTWENALNTAMTNAKVDISGVGIAMPGPFDYENGISYIKGLNKYEALYGKDIKGYLAERLQLNPFLIRFRNDAEATITGEALAGAGKNIFNVMGITLGTGFGSACRQNNVTLDLNLGSKPFQQSIADDYLSTRWFVHRYAELSGISVAGVKELSSVADNSTLAREVFREFAVNLSSFLAGFINQLQPDILLICGNIAKASPLFLPFVKKQLKTTSIQLGQLGEHAALIGAAGMFEPYLTPLFLPIQPKNVKP